jgi:hypothetical protein
MIATMETRATVLAKMLVRIAPPSVRYPSVMLTHPGPFSHLTQE